MTPGEKVRERREELGLSIAELARRAGLAREYLSKIENGHVGVGDKTAAKLAPALELDAGELLPERLEPANLTTLLLRVDGQGGLLRQIATELHRVRTDLDALLVRLGELEVDGRPRGAAPRARRTGTRPASSN